MTIEDPEIIKTMLKNNGIYPGDPQASSIYSCIGKINGKELYAVFLDEKYNDIDTSPFVTNPKLLWSRVVGLTHYGAKLCQT